MYGNCLENIVIPINTHITTGGIVGVNRLRIGGGVLESSPLKKKFNNHNLKIIIMDTPAKVKNQNVNFIPSQGNYFGHLAPDWFGFYAV